MMVQHSRPVSSFASDIAKVAVLLMLISAFAGSWLSPMFTVALYYIIIRAAIRSATHVSAILEGEGANFEGLADEEWQWNPVDLLRAGRYEDALEILDRAIEADPTDAERYLYRGMVLRHLAEDGGSEALVRSAIRDLQAAMLLSRTIAAIPQVDLLLGRLFFLGNEQEKSRRHLTRVVTCENAPEHIKQMARSALELVEKGNGSPE